MAPQRRVVIYVRGTPGQREDQLARCLRRIEQRGYDLIGVIHEQPDEQQGWRELIELYDQGLIDAALIAADRVAPRLVPIQTADSTAGGTVRPRRIR